MLFVYTQPRIITIEGAHSDPIIVTGTILPGCSLATTGAKILVLRLLQATQSNWPQLRIKNIVDDITTQTNGKQAYVVARIAGAAKQLTTGLMALDLPLSAKKTAFMASSTAAGWAIAVHTRSPELRILFNAMRGALARLSASNKPWQKVTGPAGALLMVLARIGWTPHTAILFTTHTGLKLT